MKRPYVGFHLMLELGLGNQHPGNKGSQRQAQTGQFCEPRQAQRDEQQVEYEQLLALAPCYQRQPAAHDVLSPHQQNGDQADGLGGGNQQGSGQLFRRGAQCWDQNQ